MGDVQLRCSFWIVTNWGELPDLDMPPLIPIDQWLDTGWQCEEGVTLGEDAPMTGLSWGLPQPTLPAAGAVNALVLKGAYGQHTTTSNTGFWVLSEWKSNGTKSFNDDISSARQFVRCWISCGEKKVGKDFWFVGKIKLVLDLLNLALR